MTRIVFEAPPARSHRPRGKTKHEKIAATLIKRPGEWALIESYAKQATMSSVAHQIKHGKIRAYGPKGTFDAVGRSVEGKHRVWARYLGEHGEYA